MGKSTISMAIFNSYVKLPEGRHLIQWSTWTSPPSPRHPEFVVSEIQVTSNLPRDFQTRNLLDAIKTENLCDVIAWTLE